MLRVLDDLNNSAESEVVSAIKVVDTTDPVIIDMSPVNDVSLCIETQLTVTASDDYQLEKASFYYPGTEKDQWILIKELSAENAEVSENNPRELVFRYDWKLPDELDGNLMLKAVVQDKAGKTAELLRNVKVLTYQEPVAPLVTVIPGNGVAVLRWTYDKQLSPLLHEFIVWKTDANGENREQAACRLSGNGCGAGWHGHRG